MSDSERPLSQYDRKVRLIMESSMKRFNGQFTQEEYDLELQVAHNILNHLGIKR